MFQRTYPESGLRLGQGSLASGYSLTNDSGAIGVLATTTRRG